MKLLTIYKNNIDEITNKFSLFLFKIRNSRIKAKSLAIMEAYALLNDLGGVVVKNSPMGDIKGVFCVAVENKFVEVAKLRFNRLGYSNQVMYLDFKNATGTNESDLVSINKLAIKGKPFDVKMVYLEEATTFIEEAPDRRKFLLISDDGSVKEVKGYRGDGTETGKRALPVEDCRLLVNLAMINEDHIILDPFAGGGGIIFQAKKTTSKLLSNDIDYKLSAGLTDYGSNHTTEDVKNLSFQKNSFDAIITEVPFSETCNQVIVDFFNKSYDYLTENGRIVVMVSRSQKEFVNKFIKKEFYKFLEFDLDRKGTDVTICAYTKSEQDYNNLNTIYEQIKTIF